MIYKFKSKAGADVIMMGPTGDQVLALLGREPASQGLLAFATLTQAMSDLERGVAEDEAALAAQQAEALAAGLPQPSRAGISLRQRVWPLLELMRYSLQAGQDVYWGV